MCPYLITEVCGINLGLKRRKSLKRRDCIKISVDKERPPPNTIAPFGPSALCYCLYVSPLITALLDQVGWLTMGKQRALTFLKSWTCTSTRTHTLTNQEMETARNPPAVNNMWHVSRPPQFQITKQMTATSLSLRWEILLILDIPPPSFKLLMQWGPSHHYTST